MISKSDILKRLNTLGFSSAAVERYDEHHRYYHNALHLQKVLFNLGKNINDDELFLAAVYHDAVYDPKRDDNEKQSAELFAKDAKSAGLNSESSKVVKQMILDTKTHTSSSEKSAILQKADLYILGASLEEQIEHEHNVFREYQFLDFSKYRDERIKILSGLNQGGHLSELISYVRLRKPTIGVFCGSFNPFHRGHYNVLQKAEKIFDKVVIAFGSNPEKSEKNWPRPEAISNRQIEDYNGLLTDFVGSLGYPVVVIRGLRNSTDFQYEQNQYRYLQELLPEIRIVNIFCDKEFEHISSSGIRTLEKFDKHHKYLLE